MSGGAPTLWTVVNPARSVASAFCPAATTRSSCDSISVGKPTVVTEVRVDVDVRVDHPRHQRELL